MTADKPWIENVFGVLADVPEPRDLTVDAERSVVNKAAHEWVGACERVAVDNSDGAPDRRTFGEMKQAGAKFEEALNTLAARAEQAESERDEARETAAAIAKAVWQSRMDEDANMAQFGVGDDPSQVQKELARIEGSVKAYFDMAMGWVVWPPLDPIEGPMGGDDVTPEGRLMCFDCGREFWLDDDGNEMPGNAPPCRECR